LNQVERAEMCEAEAERLGDDTPAGHDYARRAIEHYLKALKWKDIDHPAMLPSPEDAGGPAPEGRTVPCVICSTPIPRASEGQTATGLYCASCAKL
jgi:hypothetical protein